MIPGIENVLQLVIESYPTVRKWFRSLFAIKNVPLTTTQLVCLLCVANLKQTTMSNLADKMFMSNQQLTKLVDGLVKFDLIKREVVPQNRRQILVSVSEKGSELIAQLKQEITEKCKTFISSSCTIAETTELYNSLITLTSFIMRHG